MFFGFRKKEDFMASALLSFMELKKKGYEIHLYTDLYGKSLLIDELNLKYDYVDLSHENLKINTNLWSIGKLYTHKLQKKPFIHFDLDLYLFKDFTDDFKSSGIVCQSYEIDWVYYQKIWDIFKPYIRHKDKIIHRISDIFTNKKSFTAINVGIFGGNDIKSIHEYCDSVLSFVNSNINLVPSDQQHHFCIFSEQLYLYYFLYYKNIKVKSLFGMKALYLEEFIDWEKFTHLAGALKIDEKNVDMIFKKIECK